ncbi:MAG TPA: methyltransferase domain-containing protein, partial [Polyangiales bacterium]|nr:methyltransferase domain-containing protein [Polyangiales bacterium]
MARALQPSPLTGRTGRTAGNLAALRTLRELQREARPATEAERDMLTGWSGWGALPSVFDDNPPERFKVVQKLLHEQLSATELEAAKRSTLNAHYTDPRYVRAIWDAVEQLGFQEGRVLEPGCGSGNFLELAPPRAQMVGVELDPTSAAIAAALHPGAQIHAESFAESRFAEGTFDLVIGNVPFGDVVLHDKRHNASGHSIHNHFIVKSLQLTKPGGLVALITSRYTLDAANPAARREMAELADLVGAVRLPTGAHHRQAGTDVVTDVLILRRREPGRDRAGEVFERSVPIVGRTDLESLRINEYYSAHPDRVLGELQATQGDRGRLELGVIYDEHAFGGDPEPSASLAAALNELVTSARERGLMHSPQREMDRTPLAVVRKRAQEPEGYIALDRAAERGELEGAVGVDGATAFTRVEDGLAVAYRPASTQAAELRALVGMRDTVVALLEAEASSNDDTPELDAARSRLNAQYDAYVARHGAINRFAERSTGRVD